MTGFGTSTVADQGSVTESQAADTIGAAFGRVKEG